MIVLQFYCSNILKYVLVLEFAAVVVYGGRPDAPTGSLSDSLFDEGVRMGSWGLLLHSITGSVIFVKNYLWQITKPLFKSLLLQHFGNLFGICHALKKVSFEMKSIFSIATLVVTWLQLSSKLRKKTSIIACFWGGGF